MPVKLFVGQFLPSPQQVRLAITNAFKSKSPRPEQRFRLVLCWLKNDRAGRYTDTVAEAFTSVEGIELVRFHRVVSAPGAADDWRPGPPVSIERCPRHPDAVTQRRRLTWRGDGRNGLHQSVSSSSSGVRGSPRISANFFRA